MREHCPVALSEFMQWSVFRHEDVYRIIHDHNTFSNAVIEMVLNIHQASITPLYMVLYNITQHQVNWKPAPDSRSISEIMRHLIRVDNSFLKRLNQLPITTDPGNGSSSEIYESLKKVHNQFITLVSNFKNDSDLFLINNIENANEKDTINEHILHSSQYNLYHLAQMIYLRRANGIRLLMNGIKQSVFLSLITILLSVCFVFFLKKLLQLTLTMLISSSASLILLVKSLQIFNTIFISFIFFCYILT